MTCDVYTVLHDKIILAVNCGLLVRQIPTRATVTRWQDRGQSIPKITALSGSLFVKLLKQRGIHFVPVL